MARRTGGKTIERKNRLMAKKRNCGITGMAIPTMPSTRKKIARARFQALLRPVLTGRCFLGVSPFMWGSNIPPFYRNPWLYCGSVLALREPMRTDHQPLAPRHSPRIVRMDCRDSAGEGDILCVVILDRALTGAERLWFETAESWRDPPPQRFLINGLHVSFLCARGEEKERWERHLSGFLDQAWRES